MSEFNFDFDEPVTEEPEMMDLAVPDTYEQFITNVDAYELAAKDALERLNAVRVSFDTDPEPVVETAAVVARLDKAINTVAEIKKKPHQDVVNAVNKATKRVREISRSVKDKSKFLLAQINKAKKVEEERLRQEAEKRDKKLQAALDKEAKKLGMDETPELPKTQVVPKTVTRTDSGASAHFRKDPIPEVVDIVALFEAANNPKDDRISLVIGEEELFFVNLPLLKRLHRAGRRDIPGVKFIIKETPIVRS